MRFSKKDKLNMYHMYQKGYGYSFVKKYYQISERNFYYLVQILNRYGITWLDQPYHRWTSQEKIKPEDKKIKKLEKELLYLRVRAENAYLKALRELAIKKQK